MDTIKETNITIDHNLIKIWVEGRGGVPARVKGTGETAGDPGLLRIAFPHEGNLDEDLEKISWPWFFDKFEEQGLAFLSEQRGTDGGLSRFCKFVDRESS